jgi:hypothetical protein
MRVQSAKGECYGSTRLLIVALRRSCREISRGHSYRKSKGEETGAFGKPSGSLHLNEQQAKAILTRAPSLRETSRKPEK